MTMVMDVCDETGARAVAQERLQEIRDNAARWRMPDANWAEIIVRTPCGVWTQAFAVQAGQARPLTELAWVPSQD